MKKFVSISDLKIQVMGYLYGTTVDGMVKEIRCVVVVPQVGTRESVTIPQQLPDSEYLRGLEPMGWIHTQSEEKNQMSQQDVMMHARFLTENSNWSADKTIVLTVGFTPGSCSLTAYRLTPAGYEWGRSKDTNPNPATFSSSFYEKVQLLLSDRFLGFFMVPDNQIWNYNFVGLGVVNSLKYALIPGNPKDFYHESHRPAHFLRFIRNTPEEEAGTVGAGQEAVDKEDFYE